MRVPPPRSTTAPVARASARSTSRPASSWVIRVRRVPNAKASTRRRAATAACTYCSSIRAYGRHRARYVDDEHHRALRQPRFAPAALHRIAAVAQRRPHRGAHVVHPAAVQPPGFGASGAEVRARPGAPAEPGPRPARRRCRGRSPCGAAAPPRSTPRARARAPPRPRPRRIASRLGTAMRGSAGAAWASSSARV